MMRLASLGLGLVMMGAACSSSGTTGSTGGGSATSSAAGGSGGDTASSTSTSTGSGGVGGESVTASVSVGATSSTASSGTGGGNAGPPTAADLLALVNGCTEVSMAKYKTDEDSGLPVDIPICGLTGAVFWKADLDVDCDGKQSAQCSLQTDPAYQPETSATDSQGHPLDAATLPYVVVPLPSNRFDYNAAGLALGSVIAVIYKGKVVYGVFGDEGPKPIIGEASYAMAKALGIDPDPSTGGVDSGVTYIAFTGAGAVVSTIEDHAAAVKLGEKLAATLISAN
jgi:Fungal chitosanase of glycosyl hydrolase group 75